MTLIGATTENPYFEVNSALLSRTQIYELHALSAGRPRGLLRRALDAAVRARAVGDEVIEFLAARSGGDARTALNALELALRRPRARRATHGDAAPTPRTRCSARRVLYDKAGDQHYDFISAWIKSTRGSDPDASLYYLAAMLEGGEDPRFIARRMVILASEDVGNADPQALRGRGRRRARGRARRPARGQYALAQAAIYLSLAPKSNAAERALGARARAHPRARRRAAARRAAVAPPTRRRAALGRGRRLRLPARPPGPRQRPGAPAGRARGPALLRAGRRRARAARAAGGDPGGARA